VANAAVYCSAKQGGALPQSPKPGLGKRILGRLWSFDRGSPGGAGSYNTKLGAEAARQDAFRLTLTPPPPAGLDHSCKQLGEALRHGIKFPG